MKRLRHFPGGRIIPSRERRTRVVVVTPTSDPPARRPGGVHAFLDAVPSLGTRLLITGDLFDFWFEYRSSSRAGLPHPRQARRAPGPWHPIEVFGGNHDRWGANFWSKDSDPVHREGADLSLAGRKACASRRRPRRMKLGGRSSIG